MEKLLKSQNFTENEIAFIKEAGSQLRHFFGEHFTDIEIREVAQGLNWTQNKAKGVLSSLMKKKVIDTDHIETDAKYELIYFRNQDDLEWLPEWSN